MAATSPFVDFRTRWLPWVGNPQCGNVSNNGWYEYERSDHLDGYFGRRAVVGIIRGNSAPESHSDSKSVAETLSDVESFADSLADSVPGLFDDLPALGFPDCEDRETFSNPQCGC